MGNDYCTKIIQLNLQPALITIRGVLKTLSLYYNGAICKNK